MRVRLAKTAGFCMGVRRAMDIVFDAIDQGGDIYTYGPLVHNPQAIDMLKSKGVKVLESLSDSLKGTIVIRAHGISPEERKEIQKKGLKILDATCPRVMKVQSIIEKQAKEGSHIVIVGDREHPEVKGLLGFSQNKGVVVSHVDDIEHLSANMENICIVAQTTLNISEFSKFSKKIHERFPKVRVFNTICDSTSKRQKEVTHLAENVDCIVVIGGRNSGNTRRLVNVAESTGIETFHVETENELNPKKFFGMNTIGVTAGASTPNWMINRVVERLDSFQGNEGSLFTRFCNSLLRFTVKSNIYVAFGAGCLSYVSCLLQEITPRLPFSIIAGSYVFYMHTLYYFIDRKDAKFNDPSRAEFYEIHKKTFVSSIIFSAMISLFLCFNMGWKAFLFILFVSLPGMMYGIKIVPNGQKKILPYHKLMDIPGSKTIFIALAWGAVIAILPVIATNSTIHISTGITFFFVFVLVFVRSALFDIMDIQVDRIVGKETIPITIGDKKTKSILKSLLGVLSFVLFISSLFGIIPKLGYILLVCTLYGYISIYIYERKAVSPGILLEGIVESNFVLGWLASVFWLTYLH
ncbi:MAG: 4-hydroxy-3-methylbut-2-enyl diphosphate reductase [Thermodesulfobacteriota bacterium]|nr:4-hydroxy-3-methylbut-2-enyl diphosphate reductase [Thermodesulfobacteriota bacterium]